MADNQKKSVKEMVADALREAGVLFCVFGVLEGVTSLDAIKKIGLSLGMYTAAIAAATAVPFVLGVVIERRRKTQ